jgi:nitrous oxide reductase accessory protein NosL
MRSFIYLLFIFILTVGIEASTFKKYATVQPVYTQKGDQKYWCPVCGMSIKKFYKTSYSAELTNKTPRQYCSMRCLAVDMKEHGIDKNTIYAIDAATQKMIKAKDAFYLVNSRIKGTMSRKSKLAFKLKLDAKKFKKKYRGKIVDFQTALSMAEKSLDSDIVMIKKKKEKKIYPMGKKLYNHKCKKDIDLTNYLEINELKADIKYNHLCKELKPKYLQAVALYLWEVKRFGDLSVNAQRVKVTSDEKCPVCGMFTYKYPKWAAQIFFKHNDHKHHFSFDGVKDLMKFYFDPLKWGDYKTSLKKDITKILVTDYYTQDGIDGTKAYYVIGSNIYGPMGNELIPFKNKEDAKVFKKDHYGTKIISFDNITKEMVYKLDE